MVKASKTVATLDDAIMAYGGELTFCRAFDVSVGTLARWRSIGVRRTNGLGLYLGLRARDCDIRPQFFGVAAWHEIPGVAL